MKRKLEEDTMQQLFEFIINHWILVSLLLVIIGLLIYEESKGTVQGVRHLSPQQVVDLMNRENAIVVDIRDKTTYQKGHIINAMNILPSEFEEGNKQLAALKNKEQAIVVVCSKGQASIAAAAKLLKQGFTKVYGLRGGLDAWRGANLPLVKK